jgi:tetratricopeptide (TPR) repeat protein
VIVRLIAAHPQHRLANQFREDLAACHEQRGDLEARGGKSDAALAAWREGLGVRQALARDNPAVTRYQESLPHTHTCLAVLHAAAEDWDPALEQCRLAEQQWEARPPEAAGGWFDRARVHAILAAAEWHDSPNRAPDAAASTEPNPASAHAAAAVAALTQAVEQGWSDADRIAQEPVFQVLSSHSGFVALVRRLQGARQAIDWIDDIELARTRAAAEGKDLFVYFSGEDWCPWCAMLRNGVFTEPAFLDQVPERFVMVQLDSPGSGPKPPSWTTREQLRTRWGLDNMVPRFVLCDARGRPYFMMSDRPTTAAEWVQFLQRLQGIRAERDGHLARAAALAGVERARALDQALVALEQNPPPPARTQFISDTSLITADEEVETSDAAVKRHKYFFSEYMDIVREIIQLDADNEGGLRARYEQLVQPWWVAGPYPADLAAACPPERSTDPDSPIPAEGEIPERTWTATLAQRGGALDFREFFGPLNNASAYALTVIDSPQEREAALLVGSDDQVRIWLNGQVVHQYLRPRVARADQDLIPVKLVSGRNTLLARVANVDRDHVLYCRVSDDPLDLARALIRRGKRDAAEPYFDRAVAAGGQSWRPRVERASFYMEAGRWDEAEADFHAAKGLGADPRLVGDNIGRVSFFAGQRHRALKRLPDAVRAFRRAVQELEALHRDYPSPSFRQKLDMCREALIQSLASAGEVEELDNLVAASSDPATTANDLAWKMATSADPTERHMELAVKFARQAVEQAPRDGAFWNTLGAAEYRAGHWDAAVEALTKSMSLRAGGDSHDWVFLAMAHAQAGRRDEALVWWRKLTAEFSRQSSDAELRQFYAEAAELLGAEDRLLRGNAWLLLGDQKRAIADYTGLLNEQPTNAAALFARADVHARMARWQEAAADYDAGLAIDSSDHWHWYRSAPLRLKLNDREGYLRHCRELLARFGGAEQPFVAERIAKLCLLLPEAVEESGEAASRLAAFAGSQSEQDNLYPYYVLVKGMADYRAGRYAEAVQACTQGYERQNSVFAQALAAVYCAMAHHQAGRAEDARQWLARADQLFDTRFPPESSGNVSAAWHDWIIAHTARQEAAELFGQPRPQE